MVGTSASTVTLTAHATRPAGLTTLRTLLGEPYLAFDPGHQGLLPHGVYHRPRGWDFAPDPDGSPRGEAVVWGDYHLIEAALMVQRMLDGGPYYTFFGQGA